MLCNISNEKNKKKYKRPLFQSNCSNLCRKLKQRLVCLGHISRSRLVSISINKQTIQNGNYCLEVMVSFEKKIKFLAVRSLISCSVHTCFYWTKVEPNKLGSEISLRLLPFVIQHETKANSF